MYVIYVCIVDHKFDKHYPILECIIFTYFVEYQLKNIIPITAKRCKFTQNGDTSPTEEVLPIAECIPLYWKHVKNCILDGSVR